MTESPSAAKLQANVDVRPARSQVFLVATVIVATISLICSAGLIFVGEVGGWIFLLFAAGVLGGGYRGWLKSQSDVDLQNAHPTQLTLPDGTIVRTDSRTLRSPDAVQALGQLCQEVLCREKLPAPDGLVDANSQPIPGTKDAAIALANQINSTTQEMTNALIDSLGLASTGTDMTQQLVDASRAGPERVVP